MIKQIIFDVGGVLLDFDPRAMVALATGEESDARLLLGEIFHHSDWSRLDRGADGEEEIFSSMKSRLPQRLWPAVDKIRSDWHKTLKPREEMGELARELDGMGLSLYILSNAPCRFYQFQDRIPCWGKMKGVMLSCEEKLLKPDPALFRRLLDRFDLKPEESFFIDDSPMNVEAAHWCGLAAFQYRSDMPQLRRALRSAGVEVQRSPIPCQRGEIL